MKWPVLILLLFSSCYNYRKAANQFGRAAISFPEIPAQYCSITYPVKEKILPGKDSIKTDTLLIGGGEIIFDTVYRKDSVFFYTTEKLPGTVIAKTVYKTDTAYIENTAKLSLCEIDRTRALRIAEQKTGEADKWHRIAKKRFWIIAGLGAVVLLGLFGFLRKKIFKHGGQ